MIRTLLVSLLFFASPTLAAADFQPCQLDAPSNASSVDAECAMFAVPLHHGAPQGQTIELHMARLPALVSDPAPDPVILLAGGPGQAASDAYHSVRNVFSLLNRTREIWLIDQRGTGRSTPLDCALPDEMLFDTPAPEQITDYTVRCRRAIEDSGLDPRYFTTRDAIADLEWLRERLGVSQVNLIGASYGTRVALDYMRQHPARIRSAVLDGVVPPTLALGQDHARNLDAAIEQLFADCRASDACAERFGDPAATLAALRALISDEPPAVELRHPRKHQPIRETLTHEVLATVLRIYAYTPETAALMPMLLDELADGRGGPMMAQAIMILDSLSDSIHVGMALSVGCREDAHRLEHDPADDARLLGSLLVRTLKIQCRHWPSRPIKDDFTAPGRSQVPTLLLSGQRDPVTPPRYGEQVLEALDVARHLVAPGQGHIVEHRGCMPELVETFIASADPDSIDAGCLDTLGPPAFFISANGPTP